MFIRSTLTSTYILQSPPPKKKGIEKNLKKKQANKQLICFRFDDTIPFFNIAKVTKRHL